MAHALDRVHGEATAAVMNMFPTRSSMFEELILPPRSGRVTMQRTAFLIYSVMAYAIFLFTFLFLISFLGDGAAGDVPDRSL